MKTTLIFVSSLDGKVVRWGDPVESNWSSKEDKVYFRKIWKESKLIVIGSTTYKADKILPSANHRIVVLTRDPSKYENKQIQGQLEFTDESPRDLVARMEKEGFEEMLVAGGPSVAASFLKENLIDEIRLTIEPKIFGSGESFSHNEFFNIDLRLISCEQVNPRGTLITRYAVVKP